MRKFGLLFFAFVAFMVLNGESYAKSHGGNGGGFKCRQKLAAAGYINRRTTADRNRAVHLISACIRNKGKI